MVGLVVILSLEFHWDMTYDIITLSGALRLRWLDVL
jgi:hypothetical protein